MKFKFLCIVLLAILATGCMESVTAVPIAVVEGTVNVVSDVWDAITFWD